MFLPFLSHHQLSLLHKTVVQGDLNEVKRLITKEGADINIKDTQLGVSV